MGQAISSSTCAAKTFHRCQLQGCNANETNSAFEGSKVEGGACHAVYFIQYFAHIRGDSRPCGRMDGDLELVRTSPQPVLVVTSVLDSLRLEPPSTRRVLQAWPSTKQSTYLVFYDGDTRQGIRIQCIRPSCAHYYPRNHSPLTFSSLPSSRVVHPY